MTLEEKNYCEEESEKPISTPAYSQERQNVCEAVGAEMTTETPVTDWTEGIEKLSKAKTTGAPVENLRTENGRIFLKVADVQRSFWPKQDFQTELIKALEGNDSEKGMKFILAHLLKIGRYTQSEHGSAENFQKSQQAIQDYLNPPTPEPEAQKAPATAPANAEIPAEFATTGIAEVLKETGFDGKIIIERIPSNGNRPVVMLMPKGFDPDKPAKLLVHFHGTHSDKIAANNFKAKKSDHSDTAKSRFTQFTQQAMAAKDQNIVFAYPISAGIKRAEKGKAYDGRWMGANTGDDFDGLVRSIENRVVFQNSPEVMVSGHSAGGKVMANLAESKPQTKVSRFIFLDASYGTGDSNWAALLTSAMEKGDIPKGEVRMFLQENNYPNCAYLQTNPIKENLESKGVVVTTNRTKHAVMIQKHLLDGVRGTGIDKVPVIVASR